MSTRITMVLLVLSLGLVFSGCKEKKPDPAPAKAECKMVGDWTIAAGEGKDKVSATFTFDNTQATDLAKGSMTLGAIEINDTKILSSSSDIKAIEGGKASTVTWDYVVGEGNRKSEECKLTFVDECKALSLKCDSRSFKMTRK